MPLRKIRLELARHREFPEGSSDHGYEFTAPLTADGHFDPEEWRRHKDACTVRRFWAGEDDENGHLARKGRHWVFDYDAEETEDDEPIFRFDRHTFVEGEYVSITEHDGQQRTFRVTRVR